VRARIVVVAGLIERGGRLLISQRGVESGYAGFWEFPGGKREPGERDHAALARELREELDIDVEVGSLVWTSTAGPLLLRFYRCKYLDTRRPKALACVQFRWVRLDELGTYPFPPADDALLHSIARHGLPESRR
jgi:8-oxo-dGTP diphosphatase